MPFACASLAFAAAASCSGVMSVWLAHSATEASTSSLRSSASSSPTNCFASAMSASSADPAVVTAGVGCCSAAGSFFVQPATSDEEQESCASPPTVEPGTAAVRRAAQPGALGTITAPGRAAAVPSSAALSCFFVDPGPRRRGRSGSSWPCPAGSDRAARTPSSARRDRSPRGSYAASANRSSGRAQAPGALS